MTDLDDMDTRGWLKGQIQQVYLPRIQAGENLFVVLFEAEREFKRAGFELPGPDLAFPSFFIDVATECGAFERPNNVLEFPKTL